MTAGNIMGHYAHDNEVRSLALRITVLSYKWHEKLEGAAEAGLDDVYIVDDSTKTYHEYAIVAAALASAKDEALLYDWDLEPIRALYRVFVLEVTELLEWIGVDTEDLVEAVAGETP